MISENLVPENNPAPDASTKADHQPSNTDPKIHYQITCTQKQTWWDKWKPFVEMVGIILLAVYTGFTIKQVHVSQRSSRPFVGIDGFSIGHGFKDKDGKMKTVAPGPEATGMDFQVRIKNFGPLPAINFTGTWKMFLDGVQQPGIRLPQEPETLNPTEVIHLQAGIVEPHYHEIMSRSKVLTLNIAISYGGPEGHYQECTVTRYEAEVNSFVTTGPCPP
jgi:hypothetical protein